MAYGTFKQYRIQTEIDRPRTYYRVIEVRVDPAGIETEACKGEFKTFFQAQKFIKFCFCEARVTRTYAQEMRIQYETF